MLDLVIANLSQNSPEVSNLLGTLFFDVISKKQFLNFLSGASHLRLQTKTNNRQVLSVSVSTWYGNIFSTKYFSYIYFSHYFVRKTDHLQHIMDETRQGDFCKHEYFTAGEPAGWLYVCIFLWLGI